MLTRKRGESIQIGDGITVTVLEIRGDRIRLGIECDKSIPIRRPEYVPRDEPPPEATT